jgi:hypothetical protein
LGGEGLVMKAASALLVSGVVLLGLAAAAEGAEPLAGEDLALAQVDLELRRLGGPRLDVLAQLWEQCTRRDGKWILRAARVCEAGALPCSPFEAFLAPRREHGMVVAEAEAAARIGLLSAFEGMEPVQRRHALEAALRERADARRAGRKPAEPDALQLATLAFDQGYLELEPLIEETGLMRNPEVQAHARVARALVDEDPVARLLEIIEDEARQDAAVLAALVRQARYLGEYRRRSSGVLAVAELRRLNPPGVLRQLRQALALYEWELGGPGADWVSEGTPEWQVEDARLQRRRWQLGPLGVALAELVGDLGDPETARDVLGGPTLADRVEEGLRVQAERLARDEWESSTGCEAGLSLPADVYATVDLMMELGVAFGLYAIDNNVYPDTAAGAEEMVSALRWYFRPYGENERTDFPPADAWGHPLRVRSDGSGYEVRSLGRDGVEDAGSCEGGADDRDQDIVLNQGSFGPCPRALPPQTRDLRQRFTHCMYRQIRPGMRLKKAVRVLRAPATSRELDDAGLTVQVWKNRDGSAIVVTSREGRVVKAEWQGRKYAM